MGLPVNNNAALRELIPRSTAGKLDESGPLSASELITLLENIRARSEGIKEKVRKTVTNYNSEFLRIITQSNETVVNVEKVSEQVKGVLDLLGEKQQHGVVANQGSSRSLSLDHSKSSKAILVGDRPSAELENHGLSRTPIDIEICQLAAEVQRLKSTVKEKEEAVVVVESITSIHALILEADKKFTPTELVEAAKCMVLLQEKLGLQEVAQHHEPDTFIQRQDVRVFKFLQDAWLERYKKLLGVLEDLLSKAIVLDQRKSELSVIQRISCNPGELGSEAGSVDLSSVFTALDGLGVLDVRLVKFGDAIVKHILGPVLRNSHTDISTDSVLGSGATASEPRNVLKWTLAGSQSAEIKPEVLYPKVVQIIKFLNEHVLGLQDNRQMARFGRVVWPRLAEAIITYCLSKAVPLETSQLRSFEEIAELTAEFERALANENLIANFDPAVGDRLTTFTADVEVHFASKRRKHVLAKARDLIMQSSYTLPRSTWMSFNDESEDLDRSISLLPDPCAISLLARSLMRIVHEVLEDACLSTSRTALEFYHTARDVILLYRAIIPMKLEAMSDRMQVAALCYNDCQYIAHDLLTLVYQYREELPPSLKPVLTFVDLVPLFRQMAVEVLDREMNVVKSELMEELDHANGFQYTDEEKHFQIAQESLEEVQESVQLLYVFGYDFSSNISARILFPPNVFGTLANVKTHLQPVLSHNMYQKVIGQLINFAIERITREVLAISDIAVQETLQLQKLLITVQDRVPRFLAPAVVDVSAKEQVGDEEVSSLVLLWRKLKNLTDLLDMSLVSINQAWESGSLTSSGFSPSEVQGLIMAIFSETAFRDECIQRIGTS